MIRPTSLDSVNARPAAAAHSPNNGTKDGDEGRKDFVSSIRAAWLPCALAAALNLAVFIAVSGLHPDYLINYRLNQNSDAIHYVILGDNIFLRGKFSRCEEPPYVPDVLRTPVFPVVVGFLHQASGPAGIYLVHALLHVIGCAVLYYLAAQLFGPKPAFFASFFLSLDLTLAVSNFEVMSEPVYLFLNLAGLACLLPPLLDPCKLTWSRSAAGGALLGLATLCRPTGLYVPLVFSILAFIACLNSTRKLRVALKILLTLIMAYVPVSLWIARNWLVFGLPRLTTNDAIMLVYFFGAGGYQVEHNIGLEEAHDRISAEYNLPHSTVTNNHWTTSQRVRDMDAELRRAVVPIVSKYPSAVAISSFRGVVKASISHNVQTYAHVTGRSWEPPGMTALLACKSEAWSRLGSNPLDMVLLFIVELGHTGVVWLFASIGVFGAIARYQQRSPALITCTMLGYFLAILAIVGMEAYWRYRTPHMPLLYVLAGFGAACLTTGCRTSKD